jgi:drug/metabolite transporter (DMT)-like permease
MLMLSVGHALFALPGIILSPLPDGTEWAWIVISALVHMAYQMLLAFAYEQGDLSRVYPIARGTAPLLVLVVSLFWLNEPLTLTELLGICVLGIGVMLMARGVFSSGESRKLLPFAFGAAIATAAYSIIDGLGARHMGDSWAYVSWVMAMTGVMYLPTIMFMRGAAIVNIPLRDWPRGLAASGLSYMAFAIVVWAMSSAPIALVTSLRETSILFAMVLGWLVFSEKMQSGKILAACMIVVGVVLTRF